MKRKNEQQKGFTLIELLIVVAIISILSSLLMVNFVGIRQRARDGERKADLRQIQAALELYRSDQGAYPTSLPTCNSSSSLSAGSTVYMKTIPCDPLGGAYGYDEGGSTYCLRACLENANDLDQDAKNERYNNQNDPNQTITGCDLSGILCASSSRYSYTLQNP